MYINFILIFINSIDYDFFCSVLKRVLFLDTWYIINAYIYIYHIYYIYMIYIYMIYIYIYIYIIVNTNNIGQPLHYEIGYNHKRIFSGWKTLLISLYVLVYCVQLQVISRGPQFF